MPAGDIFFPDNPNRRARASQLANGIKAFAVQFDDLKKQRDDAAVRLKPKLDALFKKHGLLNSSDIERKIEENLNSEEMKRHRQQKERMSLVDDVESIVMGIIDFFAATSGIVLTIGVIAGIATAGAALVAAERDVNSYLCACSRYKIQINVGRMQAIAHWIQQVELWLDNLNTSNHEVVNKLMTSTLAEEYHRWTEN